MTGTVYSPGVVRLAVIAALLLVWEIGARLFADPLFLCPPSEALGALPVIFGNPRIVKAILAVCFEVTIAFALSVVIGLVLGLVIGLQNFTRAVLYPLVLLLYATPQSIILPLFVLGFGIGAPAKIAFGVSHGFFAILVTVVAGVQDLRPALLTAARSMGASRGQVLTHIVFPHMIPSFFTGMRLAMSAVLLGVLLAELYVSTGGIGYFTRMFTESFAPPNLFALITVLAVIAVTLNELCRRAERRFSRWHLT